MMTVTKAWVTNAYNMVNMFTSKKRIEKLFKASRVVITHEVDRAILDRLESKVWDGARNAGVCGRDGCLKDDYQQAQLHKALTFLDSVCAHFDIKVTKTEAAKRFKGFEDITDFNEVIAIANVFNKPTEARPEGSFQLAELLHGLGAYFVGCSVLMDTPTALKPVLNFVRDLPADRVRRGYPTDIVVWDALAAATALSPATIYVSENIVASHFVVDGGETYSPVGGYETEFRIKTAA